MSTPTILDHGIVLAMAVLLPLNQYLGRSQLDSFLRYTTVERIRFYRRMIVFQWAITLLFGVFWWVQGRPWSALGLRVGGVPGHVIAGGFAAAALAASWVYYRTQLAAPDRRERLRRRMDRIAPFLPRSRAAIPSFDALSITAGVCEEILYRGFFLWYAISLMGDSPVAIVSAVLLTSAGFSLGHLYQGVAGVLTVFLVGILHGAVYLVSGALWVPMVLHALLDAGVGRLSLKLHRDDRRVPFFSEDRRVDLSAPAVGPQPAGNSGRRDL